MAYPKAVSSEAITRLFTWAVFAAEPDSVCTAALLTAGVLMITFMNEPERGRLSHMGQATDQIEGKQIQVHQALPAQGPTSPSILRLLVFRPWKIS